MNKDKLLKIALTGGSLLLAAVTTLISNKQQEKTIEEKVAKVLAEKTKES